MSKETEDKPVFDAERVNAQIKTIIIIHNNAIDEAIKVISWYFGYPSCSGDDPVPKSLISKLKELKK